MVHVVAHLNFSLPHQVEHGEKLKAGLKRHGIELEVTADRLRHGDIHIISGPWYAWKEWQGHPNVLWLDRTFYGDSHDIVSIGWMRPDGSRYFCNAGKTEGKGVLPELKPLKSKRRCAIVFGDYGKDPTPMMKHARHKYDSVYFRPHPQDRNEYAFTPLRGDLETAFHMGDVAVGNTSTVLVDAEINGLFVDCCDPLHVVHHLDSREAWLKRLSWAQWSLAELADGSFWEHLS